MQEVILDTPEARILAAGDRLSQVKQGLLNEYGKITRKRVKDLLGISYATLYRDAEKAGLILVTGEAPRLKSEEAIAS